MEFFYFKIIRGKGKSRRETKARHAAETLNEAYDHIRKLYRRSVTGEFNIAVITADEFYVTDKPRTHTFKQRGYFIEEIGIIVMLLLSTFIVGMTIGMVVFDHEQIQISCEHPGQGGGDAIGRFEGTPSTGRAK